MSKEMCNGRKLLIVGLSAGLFTAALSYTSCSTGTKSKEDTVTVDTVKVDSVELVQSVEKKPKKDVTKKAKKVEAKQHEVKKEDKPKVEETPKEIGASPDAVYLLDDSETESSPKYADGEKALKKLLKSKLRKAKKGEKARFKASIVIKSDGSVGRVDFTSCGYVDDYKEDIKAALRSLPAFTPGKKDGVAVDSWYYIDYKR